LKVRESGNERRKKPFSLLLIYTKDLMFFSLVYYSRWTEKVSFHWDVYFCLES